ncbi:unnamed protein product, partial [Onchocerca ochengi]|uniref:Peptidase_M14 domain-containing protein n=1 Tax=Onchocerca ochengi TaxID=42157 RepID=A0A182EGC1_ONCOC
MKRNPAAVHLAVRLEYEQPRLQFPIRLAFALTINKAQGQSSELRGLDLEMDCFSNGQSHVACSRVDKPDNLYIYTEQQKYRLGTKNFNSKPVVWIDAGIHAREWASIHTALYFIEQLISEYYSSPKIEQYLKLLDIYIFPCLNPDGYEYTRTKPHHPSIRLWRKNRRSTNYYKWKNGRKQYCKGVDLNRNFDFHFAGNTFVKSHFYIYKAIRDAILRLRKRMKAYMTLHTYSQLWIYPFSNRRRSYSSDIDDLKAVAKKAVESIKKLYGTKYEYGTGPEVIYAFSGGSSDWVKATAKVKYSYTIELRPSRSSLDGFILNKRELIPLGRETYEGIKVVINKVIAEAKKKH